MSEHQSNILIESVGTRYVDNFTFDDSGFLESIRSQDLGCWSKDWENASVSRVSISKSTTCIQNNDFIKLREKAKTKGETIGKDFFIYTKIKIYNNYGSNGTMVEEIPIHY